MSQKQQLDLDGNPPPTTYEIERVSGARQGADGKPEFCVHWAGGERAWGNAATTWESIPHDTVLAVWEKLAARKATSIELESASGSERAALHNQLASLPQEGSSGVVEAWISAKIRRHSSKAQITEYMGPPSHHFKLQFEQFHVGQADPDDGTYDLLGAEVDWQFASAPQSSSSSIESTRARVARRNRQ